MAEENLKQKTKTALFWNCLELFAKYGFNFIIGIYMARLLSPEEYGITALPAVFMAIATIFTNGGFWTAMIRKPELTEEDKCTAFYYSFGIGILCYVILFFSSPFIADFYGVPVLKPLMRVTALGFVYGPLSTIQYAMLNRSLNFKFTSKLGIISRVIAGCIGLYAAYLGYGVWALVISNMLGGVICMIVATIHVKWFPTKKWSKESFKYLWGFGNKILLSDFINTLFDNISPVVIGKFYSVTDLGIYNKSLNYAQMPSETLYSVIHNVTFPVLSKMQDDNERLRFNYRRMLRVLAFVIFPIMMGLAALARPLILLAITAKWEACILLLQLLCFALMWAPIQGLNANLILVKGRSDYALKVQTIIRIVEFGMMAISLPFGVTYFCAATIVTALIKLFINTYYTGKSLDLGFIKQMKDCAPSLLLSFTMFLICFGLTYVIPNMLLQIVIGIIVGVVFYIGGAYIMKMPELQEVKGLIHK